MPSGDYGNEAIDWREEAGARAMERVQAPMLRQYQGDRWHLSAGQRLLALAAIGLAAGLYGFLIATLTSVDPLVFLIPLLILALLVIWCLPEAAHVPTGALSFLFFAFFVGVLLWPDYLALSLPGLPWITMRRIISAPLLFVMLICLSMSRQFRTELKEVLAASRVLVGLLAAIVVFQLLSIGLSDMVDMSLDRFIVAQLYWTMMFFVGCWVFRRRGTVALWSVIFCAAIIPLALIGLREAQLEQIPWANSIPSFLAVDDESVQRTLAGSMRAGTEIYRVQAIHGTSLGLAEFLALATPFLIHFVMGPFRLPLRVAAAVLIPITFYLVVLTNSRLGMMGFLLSFVIYMLAWAVRRWRQVKGSLFGPLITLTYPVSFALFVAATFYVGRLRRAVWGGGEHEASTDARAEQYRMGFELLGSNPFGYGIGRGAEALGYASPGGVLTIDTYYLLIALEYGVLGFLAYYAFILVAVWRGGLSYLRTGEDHPEQQFLLPLITSLTIFVVVKSVFSEQENHPMIFMMVAAVAALSWRVDVSRKQPKEPDRLATPERPGG